MWRIQRLYCAPRSSAYCLISGLNLGITYCIFTVYRLTIVSGPWCGKMQATYEEEAANTSNSAILHQLADYLLPRDNAEYRWRIGTALGLLVASKGLNVAVGCPTAP